mgnify:CR=1 FL=1
MGFTCRWVIGDPATGVWDYCGVLCKSGSSYCPHHTEVAYLVPGDDRYDHALASIERCAKSAGRSSSFYVPPEFEERFEN